MKPLPNIAAWRQTQDISAYLTWAEGFKLRVQQSIQQWIGRAGYEAGLLLRSLRDKAEQWWYFLEHPEVPQDFNLAERSLRLAVTKRKVSGGSRSMDRFAIARRLGFVWCRPVADFLRSVMQFFQSALMAKSGTRKSQPSLLPQPTT